MSRQTKTRKWQDSFVVKDRRAEAFTRAETRQVGRELARSKLGDQPKGERWKILHVNEEQSGSECGGEWSL